MSQVSHEKQCMHCYEFINLDATVCKYCQEEQISWIKDDEILSQEVASKWLAPIIVFGIFYFIYVVIDEASVDFLYPDDLEYLAIAFFFTVVVLPITVLGMSIVWQNGFFRKYKSYSILQRLEVVKKARIDKKVFRQWSMITLVVGILLMSFLVFQKADSTEFEDFFRGEYDEYENFYLTKLHDFGFYSHYAVFAYAREDNLVSYYNGTYYTIGKNFIQGTHKIGKLKSSRVVKYSDERMDTLAKEVLSEKRKNFYKTRLRVKGRSYPKINEQKEFFEKDTSQVVIRVFSKIKL